MAALKALVAHDDGEWRTLFADQLKASRLEVHTASQGLEALEFARQRPYQIVVLAAQLPQMSAMEFVFNLRDLAWPMPIVVVAGSHSEAHAHIWQKLGVFFAGNPSAAAREIPGAVRAARVAQHARGRDMKTSSPT